MNSRSGLRQRVLTLAVVAGCGLACSGAAFAAGGHFAREHISPLNLRSTAPVAPVRTVAPVRVANPVGPATGTQFVRVSGATLIGAGDRVTSVAPLTQRFAVGVALKLRNQAQLNAYVSKPHAPMSRATLVADYLPTAAQAQAVVSYLQRAGFRNVSVSKDRTMVHAEGSTMAVKQAFRTSMVKVRTAAGRTAFANNTPLQLPANVKANVAAVLGLQNVHVRHTLASRLAPMATPTEGVGHLTPEFADIYGASSLPAATNVDVAVWGWGSMAQTVTDLATWLAANPTVTIVGDVNGTANAANVVCTDVGATESYDQTTGVESLTGGVTTIGDPTCGGVADAGSVEWNMDSQTILGMTGGVKSLTFYAAFDGSSLAMQDALDEIVNPSMGQPTAQVIDGSFGLCELFSSTGEYGDGSQVAEDQSLELASAQGQTFSISTGDDGYDECGAYAQYLVDGYNPDNAASSPANSPYVVAASGTTLRTTTTSPAAWARENVWFDAGGSPSSYEVSPAYQAGLTYGTYAGARGPDIAFDANPGTGAQYYYYGGLIQVGGTSLSAPLFTGAWARILGADGASLGWAGPNLYAAYASNPGAFHDVTAGNNRGNDSVGGYIAQRGWDWATGLGSFNVGQVAADLAQP